MSCVYITSDWHLGHKNIPKYRECVDSVEENTRILVENYKSVVTKNDTCWFLGDMVFTDEHIQTIADLPGTKKLILGNHCTEKNRSTAKLVGVFHSIHGFVRYKDAWLSHCPIHPCELRGKFNIHGHMHEGSVGDDRYFNACVEHTGMTPIKYETIIEMRTES